MRITILGSSGQIGTYLTEYLRKKDHDVREFDLVNGEDQDMTKIPNYDLHARISTSEFVFFLAFDVGGSRYLKKYQHSFDFIDNNSRIMVNAFEYLKRYEVPFIFTSSQMSNMGHSPYGILKNVGELYTKSLNGLVTKFWNIYGIETDYDKSHVITDFIKKGFETGTIDMITDGTEEREFLYAEDCCEALEIVMDKYSEFKSTDELHITSGDSISILDISKEIQKQFNNIGKEIKIIPSKEKDDVQKDARNVADPYIRKWWEPKTTLTEGIGKVFTSMKKNYD